MNVNYIGDIIKKITIFPFTFAENGNDMIDGLLAERATKCPPNCPESNDLNSPLVNDGLAANF